MYDAIVVGLGPAGSMAAYRLARQGLKVLAIDKDTFPRFKSCGGCVSVKVDSILDFDISPVVRDRVDSIEFNFRSKRPLKIPSKKTIAYNVDREEFDHFLVKKAVEAGVEARFGERVIDFRTLDDAVEVKTASGLYKAAYLIGADGAAGVVGRTLGSLNRESCHVSITAEVSLTPEELAPLRGSCITDFGTIPHGYAWIFPKEDGLAIGMAGYTTKVKGGIKGFFNRFVESHPLLKGRKIENMKGWTIPIYSGPDQVVANGRVLVAGDAGHMVDPFLGEGIYYAIRSAQLAADAVVRAVGEGPDALGSYKEALARELYPDFEANGSLVKLIYSYPRMWYRLVELEPGIMEKYYSVLRGETSCVDFNRDLKGKIAKKPWKVVKSWLKGGPRKAPVESGNA